MQEAGPLVRSSLLTCCRRWVKRKGIRPPRYGAIGKHGSIAVVERFHRTLKEILCLITVPEHQPDFEHEVGLVIDWYNEHRPHETLGGRTPNEVYFLRPPANEQPRLEPRRKWPRGSPCSKPHVSMEGDPGDPVTFEIDCLEGRRHLPVLRVGRAACATVGEHLRCRSASSRVDHPFLVPVFSRIIPHSARPSPQPRTALPPTGVQHYTVKVAGPVQALKSFPCRGSFLTIRDPLNGVSTATRSTECGWLQQLLTQPPEVFL